MHLVLSHDLGFVTLLLERHDLRQGHWRDNNRGRVNRILPPQPLQATSCLHNPRRFAIGCHQVPKPRGIGVEIPSLRGRVLPGRVETLVERGLDSEDRWRHQLGYFVPQAIRISQHPS